MGKGSSDSERVMKRVYKIKPKYVVGKTYGGFKILSVAEQDQTRTIRKITAEHVIKCGNVRVFTEHSFHNRVWKIKEGIASEEYCISCFQRKRAAEQGRTINNDHPARVYEARNVQKELDACSDIDLLNDSMPVRSTNY